MGFKPLILFCGRQGIFFQTVAVEPFKIVDDEDAPRIKYLDQFLAIFRASLPRVCNCSQIPIGKAQIN